MVHTTEHKTDNYANLYDNYILEAKEMDNIEFIKKNVNLQVQYTKSEDVNQITEFVIDKYTIINDNNRNILERIINYLQRLRVTLVYNYYDSFVRQLAEQSTNIQSKISDLLLASNVNDAEIIERIRNEYNHIIKLLTQDFAIQELLNLKSEQLSRIEDVNYFKPAGELQQSFILEKIIGGDKDGRCKQNI